MSDVNAFKGLTLAQLTLEVRKPVSGFVLPAGPADAGLCLLLLEAHQQVFVVPPVLGQASADERLAEIKQLSCSQQQFFLHACDVASYRLAVAWHNKDMLPAPLAESHLAWPFLSFTATNVAFARQLLAVIGDWRWYWHSGHPGRLTKLYAHLGLFKDIVERVTGPTRTFSRPIEQRCHTVVKTWFDANVVTPQARLCHCFTRRANEKFVTAVLRQCRFLISSLMWYWESVRSADKEVVFFPWRVFAEAGVHQFLAHVSQKTIR